MIEDKEEKPLSFKGRMLLEQMKYEFKLYTVFIEDLNDIIKHSNDYSIKKEDILRILRDQLILKYNKKRRLLNSKLRRIEGKNGDKFIVDASNMKLMEE